MLRKTLRPDPLATDCPRAGADSAKEPTTKELILDAAEELLQRRSYNAFSYQHIAVQLGIRNAAIHYHFPAKADLGTALIQRYRERYQKYIQQIEASSAEPRVLLQDFFKIYLEYLEAGDMVCPGGVLGAEFSSIPCTMQEETRLMLREIYEWLISVLTRGREMGQLHFKGTPEGKALEIGCALQGALQIARCTDKERFYLVLQQIQDDLKPA
jgi:TetR/AcrR family transcriptional regulator, transcriptional repressor for nem operon